MKQKRFIIIFVITIAILVAIKSHSAPAYDQNEYLGKMNACESIPNGTIRQVPETSRVFVNLPADIYDTEDITRLFTTVSGNATAGYVSNGGLPGHAQGAPTGCYSTYFELNGSGEVDLTVKTTKKGYPDYYVRFIVSPNTNE